MRKTALKMRVSYFAARVGGRAGGSRSGGREIEAARGWGVVEYLVGDAPVKWNPEAATLKESSENVSYGF